MGGAMNLILNIPSRGDAFEPMDMPDFETLLSMAEWHDRAATELAPSGSDLAPSHRRAARCLREVYEYMRQLRIILKEDDEFVSTTSLGQPAN